MIVQPINQGKRPVNKRGVRRQWCSYQSREAQAGFLFRHVLSAVVSVMLPVLRHPVTIALLLLTMTAARCGLDYVESAYAAPAIPIIGAPSPEAEQTVLRALAAFTDDELGSVRAVHFTDADGTLRGTIADGVAPGWRVVNTPAEPGFTVCGEHWPDQAWIILVDDAVHCGALLSLTVVHEVCHAVAGAAHAHDAVWLDCYLDHLPRSPRAPVAADLLQRPDRPQPTAGTLALMVRPAHALCPILPLSVAVRPGCMGTVRRWLIRAQWRVRVRQHAETW